MMPFVILNRQFTPGEIDQMSVFVNRQTFMEAKAHGATDHRHCVETLVTFEPSSIRNRLLELAHQINYFYNFEIDDFREPFHYVVYRIGDYYRWHTDRGDTIAPRKLSFSIQLSDSKDYQGGELQLTNGYDIVTAPKDRGSVFAFPSWGMHRVKPVTSGMRHALVAWIPGPEFK